MLDPAPPTSRSPIAQWPMPFRLGGSAGSVVRRSPVPAVSIPAGPAVSQAPGCKRSDGATAPRLCRTCRSHGSLERWCRCRRRPAGPQVRRRVTRCRDRTLGPSCPAGSVGHRRGRERSTDHRSHGPALKRPGGWRVAGPAGPPARTLSGETARRSASSAGANVRGAFGPGRVCWSIVPACERRRCCDLSSGCHRSAGVIAMRA